MNSAMTVAAAAPLTPQPSLKIMIGSRIALKRLAKPEIFRGVMVSILPRKAENPTVEMREGRKARALIRR